MVVSSTAPPSGSNRLLIGIALGVGRVAIVRADVLKLAWRALTCLLNQNRLVEPVAKIFRRPCHDRQVSEPDLASRHRLHALRHPADCLTHSNAVRRSAA